MGWTALSSADRRLAQDWRPKQPGQNHILASRGWHKAPVSPGKLLSPLMTRMQLHNVDISSCGCPSLEPVTPGHGHNIAIMQQTWSVIWGPQKLMVLLCLCAQVDFTRSHDGETAVVERLEYDPNRSARIALVKYPAGGTLLCCV